ncbi:hypothetical protein Pcinc_001827 [Petrolisthes cinctipes]|uniref:Uncharacterized protein n=1 Tax=Petrolisthes cinctipes TaxID=88211 RepID=A0AAE1L2T7_PETCI|nr:hypothetical protein Pcinc_001827 [Petrolisthes cinctipes]
MGGQRVRVEMRRVKGEDELRRVEMRRVEMRRVEMKRAKGEERERKEGRGQQLGGEDNRGGGRGLIVQEINKVTPWLSGGSWRAPDASLSLPPNFPSSYRWGKQGEQGEQEEEEEGEDGGGGDKVYSALMHVAADIDVTNACLLVGSRVMPPVSHKVKFTGDMPEGY